LLLLVLLLFVTTDRCVRCSSGQHCLRMKRHHRWYTVLWRVRRRHYRRMLLHHLITSSPRLYVMISRRRTVNCFLLQKIPLIKRY